MTFNRVTSFQDLLAPSASCLAFVHLMREDHVSRGIHVKDFMNLNFLDDRVRPLIMLVIDGVLYCAVASYISILFPGTVLSSSAVFHSVCVCSITLY